MRESSNVQESQELIIGRDYIWCFYEYLFDKPNKLSPLPCGILNHLFVEEILKNYKRLIDVGNTIDKSLEQAINIPLMKAIFSSNLLEGARKFANNRKNVFMTSVAPID